MLHSATARVAVLLVLLVIGEAMGACLHFLLHAVSIPDALLIGVAIALGGAGVGIYTTCQTELAELRSELIDHLQECDDAATIRELGQRNGRHLRLAAFSKK